MTINVCHNCQERYPACWGSCQKYLDAKAKFIRQKKAREKDMILNDMLNSVYYTGQKHERNRRRRRADNG